MPTAPVSAPLSKIIEMLDTANLILQFLTLRITCGVFIHKLPKKYREREIEDLIRDAGAKAVKVTLFTFPNGDSKIDCLDHAHKRCVPDEGPIFMSWGDHFRFCSI